MSQNNPSLNRYMPKVLTKYLIKEFTISLLIFLLIFSSIIIFSTYLEEIVFFKNKEIVDNFFIKTFVLSLIKSPTLILNFSPFIFLFSGIFFYVKFARKNEITSINLSGISNNLVIIVPGLYSFILGVIFVLCIYPLTSELSKQYESFKKKYSENDNLIIMSDNGIWIKEKKNEKIFIIRTDKVTNENFSILKNPSIVIFENYKFKSRIDGDNVEIEKNNWIIQNAKYSDINESKTITSYHYKSKIDLERLKYFFNNSDVFSIWNILNELDEMRKRGYYGQELIIKLNKYLSLPFLLFSMVFLSTLFTLNSAKVYNNFIYIFLGVLVGIFMYFLSDLSIALGKSGKVPIIFSVWFPVILIMTFTTYSLLKNND